MKLSLNDTQHNDIEHNNKMSQLRLILYLSKFYCYTECRYADFRHSECFGTTMTTVPQQHQKLQLQYKQR